MKKTIPLIFSLLLLAACGKKEAPAPAPAPAPVQMAPAPAPEPMPAAASAAMAEPAAAPAPMAAEMAKPASGTHVVVSRDTLYEIAKANNIKVGDLMKWNNIKNARQLKVGKELRLSAPAQ